MVHTEAEKQSTRDETSKESTCVSDEKKDNTLSLSCSQDDEVEIVEVSTGSTAKKSDYSCFNISVTSGQGTSTPSFSQHQQSISNQNTSSQTNTANCHIN